MAEPARRPDLHVVDTESGELQPQCPTCTDLADQLAGAQKEIRSWRSSYANLKRDKDAEARDHKLWPVAVTLWTEWKVATDRTKCRWDAGRFWLAQPYLEADGFVTCRWAVWGVAYEPNRKVLPSGLVEVYSDWELLFRNRGTFERYTRRGFMNPEAREQFDLREQGIEPKES